MGKGSRKERCRSHAITSLGAFFFRVCVLRWRTNMDHKPLPGESGNTNSNSLLVHPSSAQCQELIEGIRDQAERPTKRPRKERSYRERRFYKGGIDAEWNKRIDKGNYFEYYGYRLKETRSHESPLRFIDPRVTYEINSL